MNATDEKNVNNGNSTNAEPLVHSSNKTRISTAWFMIVAFIVGLAIILIFIVQNLQDVTLHYLGMHWKLPLGVALLLALVFGGLMVALFGIARVVQLGHKDRGTKTEIK